MRSIERLLKSFSLSVIYILLHRHPNIIECSIRATVQDTCAAELARVAYRAAAATAMRDNIISTRLHLMEFDGMQTVGI
jgi:hypothetical protein